MSTRTGKIARLPKATRDELGRRIENGELGKPIVDWLNGLPHVQELLEEQFGGRPVSEQNLSEWKQGGHREWLRQQETLSLVSQLTEQSEEVDEAADGQRVDDHRAVRTHIQRQNYNREMDREEEEALKREEKEGRERLLGSILARQRLDPLAQVCGGGESGHDLAATILEIQQGLDLGALGRKSAAGRATLIPNQTASGLIKPNQTDQTNLLAGHTPAPNSPAQAP